MSASLSIRAIDKIYHRRGKTPVHAVKALSMDVGRGEIVALLGSSGCGKTSTLRMVAGFEDVSAGAIILGGTARRMPRACGAKRRHGLRGLFALSAADCAGKHRLCAEARTTFRLRRREAGAAGGRAGRDRIDFRSLSQLDFRRAAAARLAGAGAGARRRSLRAGRTDGAARAATARGAARPAEAPAQGPRHDVDLRHP